MTTSLNSAIVRIRTANGRTVIGAGFLVTNQRIFTCAHVVTIALDLLQDSPNPSQDILRLDFPLLASDSILTACVIYWQPTTDIAVLELTTDPPAGSKPVRLVTANNLWAHSFRAFGFPSSYEDGVWTSGVLRGQTAAGWVQIEDVKEPGYWIQPGFSGAPVWDEQLDGVAGIAVAADTDRVTKAAFMILAQALIEAWPELAERSLEAGSLEHLQMQLARLEEAQRQAADPGRFRPQIGALRERITTWGGRVERQRERIAEGLEEQRQRMAEERARRRKEERLRVVGQPPLDVADYFKDRERDLEKLGQLLSEPTTRMVSVLGHGGMGKTALACKALQDLARHRWPYIEGELPIDGIVYLSTRTAGISLERLFLDCAKLLGGEDERQLTAVWTNPRFEIEEKITRLLKALRNGRYVILLDNMEDLLDDQGQLADDDLQLFFDQSLRVSQGAKLIITSRVALAFRREVMRFDRQVNLLEGLPTEDGVALLRELDPNGDYGLRDAREEQLSEAVELTHGMPRALEVLAGILANDPFATLGGVLKTFYEQEDVVQALIEENYQRLDQDARRVIEALAVFRKPVPPLAVDYLLEPFAPGLDVPSIVWRLTRTNVVSVDRAAKTVTLHPIDQDYAYSQLPDEAEAETEYTRQALERRAADYYVQLRTPEETWKSIDDLESQLNEFEHRVRAGDYNKAYYVLKLIGSCMFTWGHYARSVEMRRKLVGHLTDPQSRAFNQNSLGCLYRALGDVKIAVELHHQALIIAREAGDQRYMAFWLADLGSAYRDLGQVGSAIELYEEALDVAYEMDNRLAECILLGRLGFSSFLLGRIEHSIEFYKDGLIVAHDIGNQWGEEGGLSGLGDAYLALGQIELATKLYERALAIAQDRSSPRGESIRLGRLGNTYKVLGEFIKSFELYSKALSIACEINDLKREVFHLGGIADVYLATGQIKRAIDSLEQAFAIACDIGNQRGQRDSSVKLSRILLTKGQLQKAYDYCEAALALEMPSEINYEVTLILGILSLHKHSSASRKTFVKTVSLCQALLDKAPGLYAPRYTLATALVGQAVCDPRWTDEGERPDLLAPALEEYHRALEITAAPGVVQDAIRDLELIQMAGIEGLEPVFELLENAEYKPDDPEELSDILEDLGLTDLRRQVEEEN